MKSLKAGIKAPFPELRGSMGNMIFPAFAEVKLDGEYNQIEYRSFRGHSDIFCINKYGTIKSEFPALSAVLQAIKDKVFSCTLLCEVYVTDGKLGRLYDFLSQKTSDSLMITIHDVAQIDDVDLKPLPTLDRKEKLQELLDNYNYCIQPKWINNKQEAEDYFNVMTGHGFEGIVLKSANSPMNYGPCDWVKMKYKDRNNYDVVLIDPHKERIEICAYGPPGTASHIRGTRVGVKAPNRYKKYIKVGDVVEIEHQGRLKSGSLRHPTLIARKEWV